MVTFKAAIGTTPHGGILLGKADQKSLGVVINTATEDIHIKSQQLRILQDDVQLIKKRMRIRPLRMVMTISGCCFVMCVLRDLGYRFERAVSVEKDEICRSTTSFIDPSIEHHASNDVTNLSSQFLKDEFDVLFNSADCAMFSWCNVYAKGFEDHRIGSYTGACEAKGMWQHANSRLQSADENVKVAGHLNVVGADKRMDREWGTDHVLQNSTHVGGISSRPRSLAVDFADISLLQQRPPVEVNDYLEVGFRCPTPVTPCVVASEITHNPPLVYSIRDGAPRQITPNEALRVMGYPNGLTRGSDETPNSPQLQRRLIGKAVDYVHMWHIFRELKNPDKVAAIALPLLWDHASQDQYELFLFDMDGPTLLHPLLQVPPV